MLHGWTNGDISDMPEFLPDNKANWMGWTKHELEKRGYTVFNPFIQYGYKSEYKEWKKKIDNIDIDHNTILVGWSSGGAFWVRWLGETKQHVKKLILVAPAHPFGLSERSTQEIGLLDRGENGGKPWNSFHNFSTDITIPERVKEITIFVSNDSEWLVESAHVYTKELNAKLVVLANQGHFENHRRPSPEFPEMLKEILEVSK